MSASIWPFIERHRSDRRKSERRQQPRARASKSGKTADRCTAREREVVELLLQGMTNKQIAQELRIAEDTVKKHLLHAYRKLGVHRRVLLMLDEHMK
jgi:DNA-binding NarL/FixJ family response regulator